MNIMRPQEKIAAQGYVLKQAKVLLLTELKPINDEAKGYSKSLLVLGNLAVTAWILLSALACWFLNALLGWGFLVFAFVMIFGILRRMGCNSCYYCKSCTSGFGKLADLFFGSGYMVGVGSSSKLKIIFVYGLLGIVPIGLLTLSLIQDFAVTKIAVLAVLLLLLFYSSSRKPK
jgi:hypothetical protein